ncbi:MAG: hypothetical protein M3Q52_10700, partial [Pseudomonadota bacterium]|nr:hypothetical protein [Pseudomonadota bacterium]
MIDRRNILSGRAALPLLGTAAALLFATTAAVAQQAQPAATAQPTVMFGIGVEEGPGGPTIISVSPDGTAAAIGVRPGYTLFRSGERRSPAAMWLPHTYLRRG